MDETPQKEHRMHPTQNQMDRLWTDVNQEVSTRGLLVFPGRISLQGPMAFWPTEKGTGAFLDLALALGCRLVYVHSRLLAPEDLVDSVAIATLSSIDVADDITPEDFLEQAGVGAEGVAHDYLRYGTQHYGLRLDVSVEWVYEGVVHKFVERADWHPTLVEKAGRVAELIDELQDEGP